ITEAVRDRRGRGFFSGGNLGNFNNPPHWGGPPPTGDENTRTGVLFLFCGPPTTPQTSPLSRLGKCRHTPYIAELQAEQDAVFAAGKEASMTTQRDIPLLDGFIRESLRVHPPLNAITRRVLQDFDYNGYHIEAGKNVMLCPHVAHKLPDYFPD